jgi:thioredoxin 1
MHGATSPSPSGHSLGWARSLIEAHGRDLARLVHQRGLSAQEGFAGVEACLCAFLSLPQAQQIASQPDDTRRLVSLLLSTVVQTVQVRGDAPPIPVRAGEFDPHLIRLLLLDPRVGVCDELGLSAQEQKALRSTCPQDLPERDAEHATIQHWTEELFEQNLARSGTPVLVHFVASWCKPCHLIEPYLEELAQQRAGSLLVASVDVEKSPSLPVRYRVRALPTLLLFRGESVVSSQVGASTQPHLTAWLDEALAG